jgi:hypothetical protein
VFGCNVLESKHQVLLNDDLSISFSSVPNFSSTFFDGFVRITGFSGVAAILIRTSLFDRRIEIRQISFGSPNWPIELV